ncbi:MAG: molybdate ABC transporter substrate-binding protein [Endozoicomonas sp.]
MRSIAGLILVLFALPGKSSELRVAVAANFKPVLDELVVRYHQTTGQKAVLSSASAGVLYNQIIHGAPFDVFLSADSQRPRMLDEQGLVIADSRTPYAYGQLVLWNRSGQPPGLKALASWKGRLAIANPVTAPYGLAARQVLEKLGLWSTYQGRLIQGNSIQQAWQFVASGNAPIGMVASSLLDPAAFASNAVTSIPADLYDPIRQELVILKRTDQPQQARQFVGFLLSSKIQEMIAGRGYLSPVKSAGDQHLAADPEQPVPQGFRGEPL